MQTLMKKENSLSHGGIIKASHIKAGMTYAEYRGLIEQLLLGSKTTGEDQSPGMVGYTRVNVQRMNYLDRKVKLGGALIEALEEIHTEWYWVVLTEAWCGDAAQNIPILAKIAEASPKIQMKILLRDQDPEIVDHYLTNNKRAIPKLICVKQSDLSEVGVWGSRPSPVQQLMQDYKANPTDTQEEFMQNIHNWYHTDKGNTLQEEMRKLIREWNSK